MQLDSLQLESLRTQLATLTRTIADIERGLKPAPQETAPRTSTKPQSPGYRLFGQDFSTRNANETLVALFRHFAELEPAFPHRFQQAPSVIGRSRRYVGRTVQEVYPGKEQLWDMTTQFAPGWYIGTNENNGTKLKLLRLACRVIGLRFGKDVEARM